jgi:hypothetical protein
MKQEELNNWFSNLEFKLLEQITRLKSYYFSNDDGYQDFVDTCENWWKQLSIQEKNSIYNEYA